MHRDIRTEIETYARFNRSRKLKSHEEFINELLDLYDSKQVKEPNPTVNPVTVETPGTFNDTEMVAMTEFITTYEPTEEPTDKPNVEAKDTTKKNKKGE